MPILQSFPHGIDLDYPLQTRLMPVLTCQWTRKIFFGPAESESPMSQFGHDLFAPSLLAVLYRYFDLCSTGLIGTEPVGSTLDLIDCWFPFLYTPHSLPQQNLQWFDHTLQWMAHFPELPQTCFQTDQAFQFVHAIRDLQPTAWAWTLDSAERPVALFEQKCIHESFRD